MDSLKKRLRKFRSLKELKSLSERLFQKNPQILANVENLLESVSNERDASSELRHFILRTVTDAIDRKVDNLPRHIENYVSFCDLIYVMQRSHDRVWHTIRLQDFPCDQHEKDSASYLSVYDLRKAVKKRLIKNCPNLAASVQQDFRLTQDEVSKEDESEMIFFRIASVPNLGGKKPEKVEKKLCSKKPTFVVYFPGEPYIYVDSRDADSNHVQALTETLKGSSHTSVPLAGRKVESLRKMRLLREEHRHSTPGDDFELPNDCLPTLENFTLEYVSDDEELVLDFHGSNILSGWNTFKDLGVFPNGQVPSWAMQSHVRGRNTIKIVGRKTGGGKENTNHDDHDDDAESDVTAL